jgi:replication factor C subunit 1
MFTEKYRPTAIAQIIQTPDAFRKLDAWLVQWRTAIPEIRAALISGPPGIGKTTAALCIAHKYGYDVVEINASDTRSAKTIREIFRDSGSQGSQGSQGSCNGIFGKKTLFIVDEVDGMSSSDRGGIAELNKIIAETTVPILCICNDRQSKQARALAKHVVDVRWSGISTEAIAKRLMEIAIKEHITLSKSRAIEIATTSAGDMRLALNSLQMWGNSNTGHTSRADETGHLDAFTATQRLFERKGTFEDTERLVSVDYDLIPLLAQQYYADRESSLDRCVALSSALSNMEIVNEKMRHTQNWGLLPAVIGITASTLRISRGVLPPWVQFPVALAKGSSMKKRQRQISAMAIRLGCNVSAMRLDYLDPIQTILLGELCSDDCNTSNIATAAQQIADIGLTRDDMIEGIVEMSFEPVAIPAKTKAAFTRAYNKLGVDSTARTIADNDADDVDDE